MREIALPVSKIYGSRLYIEASRMAKLAIWQILAHWWLNGCQPLPNDSVLEVLAGIRSREWIQEKAVIKSAVQAISGALQPIHGHEYKKLQKRLYIAQLALEGRRKSARASKIALGRETESVLTDMAAAHAPFTVTKPLPRAFHEGMSDSNERLAALLASTIAPVDPSTFIDQ